MPARVLIVEDEESASRLIASICSELGLGAQVTRSGAQAKDLLTHAAQANQPFSAMVLDLVLADLDGFQVGQFARGQPWGLELPLIVVSGVYKQPNAELMARMTQHRFRHLPVVKDGNLIGIVSIGDLVKNRIEEVEFEADSLRSFIAS